MKLLNNKKFIAMISFAPLAMGIIGLFFCNFLGLGDSDIKIDCIFHDITGIRCPGCGGTRALFNFFRFNFIKSFKYNFVYTLGYFYIVFIYFRYLYQYLFKKKYSNLHIIITIIIFLSAVIIYGVLRNVFPSLSIA